MSCMFRIEGKNFNVDAYLEEVGLSDQIVDGIYVHRKGEPKLKSKPQKGVKESSLCSIRCSDKSFSLLDTQINDAETFLKEHSDLLNAITNYDVEQVYFDFGVSILTPVYFAQSCCFPVDFIKRCAQYNIGIEYTQYYTRSDKRKRGRALSLFRKKQKH